MTGLPPTSASLALDDAKPYFLWWADLTSAEFRRRLRHGLPEERAYWLGALLREANTRDVWLFTSVREIEELWPQVYRHLGKSRAMWSFLLRQAAPGAAPHASKPLAPRDRVEGVVVESLADLRANKLTCLLSRSEPRDLVDLYFLERAGHPPEEDLKLALEKDAGLDPGILAHLLTAFPVVRCRKCSRRFRARSFCSIATR